MNNTRTGNDVSLPLAARSLVGGTLMGLANLVPGISGGTMLLAAGIYPQFIEGIAEVTTLRFRRRSLLVLICVVGAAMVAIVAFAGPIKNLVVHHRWIMYSLFIGLTLGGVPVVWTLIGRRSGATWIGAVCGFCCMATLAWVQTTGLGEDTGDQQGFVLFLIAGAAGASAMILPGVSGGYLLLVLGTYVPILAAIDHLKELLKNSGQNADWSPVFGIILPVGIGVVLGIVVVSNILKLVLARYKKATLGVLLGLLLGAVIGLWPFQAGREPQVGEVFRGRVVTVENLEQIRRKPHRYPTQNFAPSAGQIASAIGLVILGFAATSAIARFGSQRKPQED